MNKTTSTMKDDKPITLEDIKEASRMFYDKGPKIPEEKKSWLHRLMNKFGWYRHVEVIVIDQDELRKLAITKIPFYRDSTSDTDCDKYKWTVMQWY